MISGLLERANSTKRSGNCRDCNGNCHNRLVGKHQQHSKRIKVSVDCSLTICDDESDKFKSTLHMSPSEIAQNDFSVFYAESLFAIVHIQFVAIFQNASEYSAVHLIFTRN